MLTSLVSVGQIIFFFFWKEMKSWLWIQTIKNRGILLRPSFWTSARTEKLMNIFDIPIDRDMVGGLGVEVISAVCPLQYQLLGTVVG